MPVLNLALSNCALSREYMSNEFEKQMKNRGSMSGVWKVASDGETPSVAVEAHDVATPSSHSEPLVHDANASIADVVSLEAVDEASRDEAEAFSPLDPLPLVVPLDSSVANEGAASIDIVDSTEANNDVTPADNVDDSFATIMEEVGDAGDGQAANVDAGMEEMHGVVNEVESNTVLSFKEE